MPSIRSAPATQSASQTDWLTDCLLSYHYLATGSRSASDCFSLRWWCLLLPDRCWRFGRRRYKARSYPLHNKQQVVACCLLQTRHASAPKCRLLLLTFTRSDFDCWLALVFRLLFGCQLVSRSCIATFCYLHCHYFSRNLSTYCCGLSALFVVSWRWSGRCCCLCLLPIRWLQVIIVDRRIATICYRFPIGYY